MAEGDEPTLEQPRPGALLWGTPWRELRTVRSDDRADVVLAEHADTKERAFVKVVRLEAVIELEMPSDRERFGDRVRLEAEAMRAVAHPSVLGPIDVGHTPDQRPYFATPVLAGARTLGEVLRERGTLSVKETLRIAKPVLEALGAAHDKGIVHRQIEPDSIVLANEYVFLSDFGLAKILEPERAGIAALAKPTTEGRRLGVPKYFSPEQSLGKRVDARTDLYQVGLVLFECLAGRGPFDGMAHGESGFASTHAFADAPSLAPIVPGVPERVVALVARALAKRPEDRSQTAKELLAAIDAAEPTRTSTPAPVDAPTELLPAPALALAEGSAEPAETEVQSAGQPVLIKGLLGLVAGLVVLVLLLFFLLLPR